MRGKEASRKLRGTLKGITPAYAGKRAKRGRLAAGRWDHPRVCGEKALIHGITFPSLGSPPRMRGKAHALKKRPLPVGITPAYAGKSSFLSGCTRMPRDHPRVCGEKLRGAVRFSTAIGSPPRMRGKACIWIPIKASVRITPAYAGKSRFRGRCRTGNGDHPRVCGEKRWAYSLAPNTLGSPPRMRGKGLFVRACHVRFRITPAYAGKSFMLTVFGALKGDHPRVCGEKDNGRVLGADALGSPPRMRGKD